MSVPKRIFLRSHYDNLVHSTLWWPTRKFDTDVEFVRVDEQTLRDRFGDAIAKWDGAFVDAFVEELIQISRGIQS